MSTLKIEPHHSNNAPNGGEWLRRDEVIALVLEQVRAMPKQNRPYVNEAQEAHQTSSELYNGMARAFEGFKKDTTSRIAEMRGIKLALVGEVRQMLDGLKDVRSFFLDVRHDEEVKRLKEFIDLCERLKALKESGFLDTVADTMLRLSEKA